MCGAGLWSRTHSLIALNKATNWIKSTRMLQRIIAVIWLLLIIASCSALPDDRRSDPALEFLPGRESARKLVVFVHGVLGTSTTWTNSSGESWPELMNNDSAFKDYRIATYRFNSPYLDRSSTNQEISTRMFRQLDDAGIFRSFSEIYFITHSMGGLVTKRVLVSLNSPQHIEKLRVVKAVLYLATPAQGADIADLGTWFSLNPQFRDMQSAEFNSYLQNLEDEWADLMRQRGDQRFPLSFCAYEKKPIFGQIIVSRTRAATTCDENPVAFEEDHLSIVKPLNRQAAVYDWAQSRILHASDLAQAGLRSSPSTPSSVSDVRLVVGHRTDPVFWLYNPSKVAAQQPKYQLNLWNLNLPDSDKNQPRLNLRIPVKVMQDYILSERALGPWRILDLSPKGSTVAPGHVIFGYAQVQCLNCQRMRIYWIYLKNGESGWISEIPPNEEKMVTSRLTTVLGANDRALSMVDQVIPMSSRQIVP